jgi:hypothetical protein
MASAYEAANRNQSPEGSSRPTLEHPKNEASTPAYNESPYEQSWRIYFEDKQDYAAFFYDPADLTAYLDTVPTDIAFKIVNQDGEVVYVFHGKPLPINASQRSGWKDVQSTPHGRKTLYQRMQEQAKPSSRRRKDINGDYK